MVVYIYILIRLRLQKNLEGDSYYIIFALHLVFWSNWWTCDFEHVTTSFLHGTLILYLFNLMLSIENLYNPHRTARMHTCFWIISSLQNFILILEHMRYTKFHDNNNIMSLIFC